MINDNKMKQAERDSARLIEELGKLWDADGVMILAAWAEPVKDGTTVGIVNVAGGSNGFKAHLSKLLRESADEVDSKLPHAKCNEDHRETAKDPGNFPKFLSDLMRSETGEPGAN